MGFHFEAQGELGAARSRIPNLGRQQHSYKYHAFLYSMSCKDLSEDQRHQSRRSVPALKRPTVPPRQSPSPVLDPSSLQQRVTRSGENSSVSTMNSMLPLPLQSGIKTSGFDFSSWIESTIEDLRHPFIRNSPAHKERDDSMDSVPWMQEEQDTTFTTLQPRKYREAAVYSDPGSSLVSFPYCGCEGLGSTRYDGHGRISKRRRYQTSLAAIF